MDKIHSRCIRTIEYKKRKDRDGNIQNLMNEYGIQNIRERRKVQLLSFMFNESKISNNLKLERPYMVLRSSTKVKFKEKFTRKTTIMNSPLYRGFALWNELSEEVQKIDSQLIFKNRIKSLYYVN